MSIENRGQYYPGNIEGIPIEDEGEPEFPVSQHIQERYRERAPSRGGSLPVDPGIPIETPLIREGNERED